jgi:hypothetical protein
MIPLLTPVIDLINKFIPDQGARDQVINTLNTAVSQAVQAISKTDQGQVSIDADDANSESFYRAGWRPFIAWTCGLEMVIELPARSILSIFNINMAEPNMALLSLALTAILGLGGLRTVEKFNGVN